MGNKKEQIYILGDILKKGNSILRGQEAAELRNIGYDVYSASEQKDINDKVNQTVESNNKLAERIVAKDMEAIRKSNLIVADVDNDSVGSSCEVGAIFEFNWFRKELVRMLHSKHPQEAIREFLREYPEKEVYFHTTDIRHTDLPEIGMRRSFSINQFLHGMCLGLNKCGIKTWDWVVEQLKERNNK